MTLTPSSWWLSPNSIMETSKREVRGCLSSVTTFLSSSSTRVTTSKLTLFGHNVHKGPAAEGDEDYDEEKEM